MLNLPITVYTPDSALRHPRRLLREMFCDLVSSRELAWRLFVRDLKARYRQSALGYIWAFLPPIATTIIFVALNRSGILATDKTSIPYPVYVVIGTLLWQVFAEAVTSPIRTVAAAKSMLTKVNMPREAILVSGLLEVMFNFAIRLVLLLIVSVYYRMVPPTTAPLAFLGVFGILCLGFTIGIVLTPIGLLYQDVGHALSMLLGLWMLLTPVVYVPPASGPLATFGCVNPVTPLIRTTRDWLTTGTTTQLWLSLCVLAASLFLLFVGWGVYRLAMPYLIERMGG